MCEEAVECEHPCGKDHGKHPHIEVVHGQGEGVIFAAAGLCIIEVLENMVDHVQKAVREVD